MPLSNLKVLRKNMSDNEDLFFFSYEPVLMVEVADRPKIKEMIANIL